jgi:hypothetical protein
LNSYDLEVEAMSPATRIRTLGSVVAALMLVALTAGSASAATRPITFNLFLGQDCVAGRASDNRMLDLVWRSAAGNLKAKATVPTSGDGYWSWCPPSGSTKVLRVGDRIKATVGSTVRRLTIPTLTLNVDRAQDLFRGKAPAGTTLELFYLNGIFSDYYDAVHLTVNAHGRWSFDPGWNIKGGITADMQWNGPSGDKIWLTGHAAVLRITIGKPGFAGETRLPYGDVQVVIENANTGVRKGKGTAVGDDYGTFSGKFRNAQGNLVSPAVGDRIKAPSLASDANWIVPNIAATANAGTNVVNGRCFDAGTSAEFVEVRVIRSGVRRGYALTSTDQDGFFAVDFDDPESPFLDGANVKPGDRIGVHCLQTTGDWIATSYWVP